MKIFKKSAEKIGTLIFTFPDGKKLYQVKEDYFERLPSEKLRIIQENSNYIAHLGISKTTLEAGHKMLRNLAYEISALTERKDKSELKKKAEDLGKLIDQIDTTRKEYDNTNEAIMVSLFDLFYFFEGEIPFVWSEESLEIKRYYLREYPYFRAFFFRKLNDYIADYRLTYQTSINIALAQSTVQELIKDWSHIGTSEASTI